MVNREGGQACRGLCIMEVGVVGRGKGNRCRECLNRLSPEWCCMSGAGLDALEHAKMPRAYGPGDIIYNQGTDCEGIYCVSSGLVGLRRIDKDGNSILVRLVHPGGIIGYRSLVKKAPHGNTAEVLASSTVCFVNRRVVCSTMRSDPDIGLKFLSLSLNELSETEDRYLESVTLNAKARLLHALMIFYERSGIKNGDEERMIELPISRQDLAELIGTAPETMSRTIQRLQNEGLAHFDGRKVRIFNRATEEDFLPMAQ